MTGTNSAFLRHAPCPKCHSRDNLGIYSDGHEWCFGCGYYKPGKTTLKTVKTMENNNNNDDFFDRLRLRYDLPIPAKRWLKTYGILDSEIDAYGIAWLPDHQLLGFPFFENETLVCINGRNFEENPKKKYLTRGKRTQLHVWGVPDSDTIIFVEDCLSAIKVGRSYSTYPILGAYIDSKALFRAAERFKYLGVWLDPDKAKESFLAVSRASQSLPGRVFRVTSDRDPKEYEVKDILNFVELSKKVLV